MGHPIIPDTWTADEALRMVALLDALSAAIWGRHGPAMGQRLQQALAPQAVVADSLDITDDDIPF